MRGGVVGERQRKTHKKSRGGCDACKKRHYKCDEGRPICGGCKKRNLACNLQAQSPASDQSDESRVFAAISHNVIGHDECPDHPLPVADLELFHNSMTSTRYTISGENPDAGDDMDFAQLGFTFHYVLHSTLAISALHLYSKQPHRTNLTIQAAAHQYAALSLVRPHIVNLTEEHSHAVLAFSAVTSIFALAEPAYGIEKFGHNRDVIDELLNSFHLSRGIKTILTRQWDHFKTGPVGSQISMMKDYSELRNNLDDEYPSFRALKDLVLKYCDGDEVSACLRAVDKLFHYMAILERYPAENPGPKYVQMWPIDIPVLVIDMITARQPVALVILAYYAALMRLRSDTWWLRKWPKAVLQRIEELLDPEWALFIVWPRTRILQQERVVCLQSEALPI